MGRGRVAGLKLAVTVRVTPRPQQQITSHTAGGSRARMIGSTPAENCGRELEPGSD